MARAGVRPQSWRETAVELSADDRAREEFPANAGFVQSGAGGGKLEVERVQAGVGRLPLETVQGTRVGFFRSAQ